MGEQNVVPEKSELNSYSSKTWVIRAGILIVVFLLGLAPMLVYNFQLSSGLKAKESELRKGRMLNTLASAAIYARRGEYETARQNASTFFTDLSQETDKRGATIFSAQELQGLATVTSGRDDIITLLSRNDPASADRLSDLYVDYTGLIRSR